MTYTIDHFEDNDVAVLEADAIKSVIVPSLTVRPRRVSATLEQVGTIQASGDLRRE